MNCFRTTKAEKLVGRVDCANESYASWKKVVFGDY